MSDRQERPAATSPYAGREWESLSVDEKVERLNYTLSTLAVWLQDAQTGFDSTDTMGIWNLLHHGSAKDA